MLNRNSLLVAVCLSATAGMFVASLPAADEMTPNPTPMAAVAADNRMDFQLPPGITAKDLNSDKSIEKAYKAVAEDALSQKGFDNIVGLAVDQDRVSIAKSLGKSSYNNVDGSDNKHLNDLALSLSNTFKSKYNTKFDIDIAKVYSADFMQIKTGEVTDANQLVGKWPLDATEFNTTGGKVTPADALAAKSKYFGGDVNLEKGREIAIVHIAASHGLPGLNISMIHEAGGWKFDVPNNLTAQRLYDNLVANLVYVDSHRDQWPADANEASRYITHAVVASLYDVDLAGNGGMVRPGGTAVMDK